MSKRQGFATLSVIVLTIFYGFFMVVAFNPHLIGQRLSEGSYVTVGIAAELFMFIFFWLLTAVYACEARQRRVRRDHRRDRPRCREGGENAGPS